jgi:hypothetical protein
MFKCDCCEENDVDEEGDMCDFCAMDYGEEDEEEEE